MPVGLCPFGLVEFGVREGALTLSPDNSGEARIAIVDEQLSIERREVITDRMRVSTVVDESDVLLKASIERGAIEVERVALDREVETAPSPREEGDVLVVSVVEERAEIVTCLFVVEELRIRRTSATEAVALPATVRKMRAIIDRDDAATQAGDVERG